MKKKIIKRIIDAKGEFLLPSDIKEMLEAELAKPEKEMDTELVERCTEALERAQAAENEVLKLVASTGESSETAAAAVFSEETESEDRSLRMTKEPEQRHSRFSARRLVFIAVAVIVLTSISLSSSFSKEMRLINTEDSVVKYKDYIGVDMLKGQYKESADNAIKYFNDNGFDNLMLPKALLSGDYELYDCATNISGEGENTVNYAGCSFREGRTGISGSVSMMDYFGEFAFAMGSWKMPDRYKIFEKLEINSVEVLVASTGESNSTITYVIDNREYMIEFACGFEAAREFAETLESVGVSKGE